MESMNTLNKTALNISDNRHHSDCNKRCMPYAYFQNDLYYLICTRVYVQNFNQIFSCKDHVNDATLLLLKKTATINILYFVDLRYGVIFTSTQCQATYSFLNYLSQ